MVLLMPIYMAATPNGLDGRKEKGLARSGPIDDRIDNIWKDG